MKIKEKENQKITKIKNIKCSDFKKKITIVGKIINIGKIRAEITKIKWECQSCGEKFLMLQDKQTIEKPQMCECGNKSKFFMLARHIQDYQEIIIDDDTGNISIILEDKMVEHMTRLNYVNYVIVNGIVDMLKSQKYTKSPLISDFIIYCKNIENGVVE